jgi:hypothetical protein
VGFRFRRRIRILPGVTLNLGKRGVSTSIGVRGAHVTVGPTGTRTTVGLPGTGLTYTELRKPGHAAPAEAAGEPVQTAPQRQGNAWRGWLWALIAAAIVGWAAFSGR